MKKLLFISALMLLVASCGKEVDTPVLENEYVVVNFSMLDVAINDMVKSPTECNDVIGIDILVPVEGGYESYAYGVFDNYDISVNLKKGKTYTFRATIDKESKNRLYKQDIQGLTYIKDGPFYLQNDGGEILSKSSYGYAITNKFVYANNTFLSHDTQMPTVMSDGNSYVRPDIERYYGTLSSYTATQDGTVGIKMSKAFFGLEIIPSDFTEGVLTVHVKDGPDMIITYPEGTKQAMYAMKDYAAVVALGGNDVIDIDAEWKDAANMIYSLGSRSFSIGANKMATITVKLPEPSVGGGFDFTIDDSAMGKGAAMTIDGTK